MSEENGYEFESLAPPPYTILTEDGGSGDGFRTRSNTLELTGTYPTRPAPLPPPSASATRPQSSGRSRNSSLPPLPVIDTTPASSTPPVHSRAPSQNSLSQPPSFIYYQLLGPDCILPSRNAFDPEDDKVGRLSRAKIARPHNAKTFKQYIAKQEGFNLSQIAGIFIDSDDPVSDDTRFGPDEGNPGSSVDYPLPITVYDSIPAEFNDPGAPVSVTLEPNSPLVERGGGGGSIHHRSRNSTGQAPRTPITPPRGSRENLTVSPLPMHSPLLPPTPESPPSPVISLAASTRSGGSGGSGSGHGPGFGGLQAPAPQSQQNFRPGRDTAGSTTGTAGHSHHGVRIRPWTIDEYGFAEPTLSLREVDRVVSDAQPPGWLTGQIQMIGQGLFMGKLKKTSLLVSGTKISNGMKIWVDNRFMRTVQLKSGDQFQAHRVIIPRTREITNIWTGDIVLDPEQHPT